MGHLYLYISLAVRGHRSDHESGENAETQRDAHF